MEKPRREQLAHDGRHAARPEEALTQIFSGGLHVHQQRQVEAHRLPVLHRKLDTRMPRDGLQMRRRVGRAADGRIDADRILEGLPREDVRGLQVGQHHLDDAPARGIGHVHPLAERRGNGRASGQRHAQRLGQRVQGRGGAHRVAMAERGGRSAGTLHEFGIVDLALGEQPPALPDDRTRACELAFPPAVEHGPAREHDGRKIHRRRCHQLRGRGLVASGGQHHPVDRIAVQHLDEAEIGEVAVERGGGPAPGLLDRMDGKFHRHAARVADARLDPLGEEEVDLVAGREIRTRLRDADDGPVALQLAPREALVLVALDIERGHPGIVGIVEPRL